MSWHLNPRPDPTSLTSKSTPPYNSLKLTVKQGAILISNSYDCSICRNHFYRDISPIPPALLRLLFSPATKQIRNEQSYGALVTSTLFLPVPIPPQDNPIAG